MNAAVYIVKYSDNSYYTGSTRVSLELRIAQHNEGSFGGYTASRRPVVLAYSEQFERIEDAIAAEQRIKGWSRAKKEALIAGDMAQLKDLSRRTRKAR